MKMKLVTFLTILGLAATMTPSYSYIAPPDGKKGTKYGNPTGDKFCCKSGGNDDCDGWGSC